MAFAFMLPWSGLQRPRKFGYLDRDEGIQVLKYQVYWPSHSQRVSYRTDQAFLFEIVMKQPYLRKVS